MEFLVDEWMSIWWMDGWVFGGWMLVAYLGFNKRGGLGQIFLDTNAYTKGPNKVFLFFSYGQNWFFCQRGPRPTCLLPKYVTVGCPSWQSNSYLGTIFLSLTASIYRSINSWVCQSISLALIGSVNPLVCQSIGLSIHWSVNPLVCQSIGLSIHRSVNPSVCQSIGLSIHWSVNPLVCQSIGLSIHCIGLSICGSVQLQISLSFLLSIYLSLLLSIFYIRDGTRSWLVIDADVCWWQFKGMAVSIQTPIPVCHIDWWSIHLDIDLLILFEDLN